MWVSKMNKKICLICGRSFKTIDYQKSRCDKCLVEQHRTIFGGKK